MKTTITSSEQFLELKATFYTPTKRISKYWQTFKIKKIHHYKDITERHAYNIALVKLHECIKANFKTELKKGYTIKDVEVIRNNWNR